MINRYITQTPKGKMEYVKASKTALPQKWDNKAYWDTELKSFLVFLK